MMLTKRKSRYQFHKTSNSIDNQNLLCFRCWDGANQTAHMMTLQWECPGGSHVWLHQENNVYKWWCSEQHTNIINNRLIMTQVQNFFLLLPYSSKIDKISRICLDWALMRVPKLLYKPVVLGLWFDKIFWYLWFWKPHTYISFSQYSQHSKMIERLNLQIALKVASTYLQFCKLDLNFLDDATINLEKFNDKIFIVFSCVHFATLENRKCREQKWRKRMPR